MTDVGFGVRSKFQIDDSALTGLQRRIQGLDKEWRSLMSSMKGGIASAIDGPQVRRAFDNLERRMKRASTVGVGGSGAARFAAGIRLGVGESAGLQAARMRHAATMAEGSLSPINDLSWHRSRYQARMDARTMAGLPGGGMAAGAAFGGTLALGAAGIYGAGRAASAIGGVQRQAETSREGIRGALVSLGGVSAGDSRGVSADIFRSLERAAAMGPGETADYAEAFQRIFAPLHRGGASYKQIEGLVGQSIAGGSMLWGSRGAQLGPMDIMQAMTSGMTRQHTPLAMMAVEAAGGSQEEFNRAKPMEQLAMLMRGFERFAPAIEIFAHTVEAQEHTLADVTKRLLRLGTDPLFEEYRANLIGINAALSGNPVVEALANKAAGVSAGLGANLSSAGGAFAQQYLAQQAMLGGSVGGLLDQMDEYMRRMKPAFELAGGLLGGMAQHAVHFAESLVWANNQLAGIFGFEASSPYQHTGKFDMMSGVEQDPMWFNMMDNLAGPGGAQAGGASPFGGGTQEHRVKVEIVQPVRVEGLDDRAFAIALTPLIEQLTQQGFQAGLSARNLLPRF